MFPADLPLGLPLIHGIEHQINLVPGASFPNNIAYRCNQEEIKELQQQINEMMNKCYVHESLSPCAILVLLVSKKDIVKKKTLTTKRHSHSSHMGICLHFSCICNSQNF